MTQHVPILQQVFMWETNLILAGGLHAQDQYRDLRLDIDHMSYEVCIFLLFYLLFYLDIFCTRISNNNVFLHDQDLLALEESMGNVCTGLKKDMISRCLKSHAYTNNAASTHEDAQIKCSICQVNLLPNYQLYS